MKIRILNLPGYAPGAIIRVKTDAEGIPTDARWRRRLKDAETDHCVEVVKPSRSTSRKELAE